MVRIEGWNCKFHPASIGTSKLLRRIYAQLGPVNEINREMLQTSVQGGQATGWGSGGLAAGGKVGFTGTYTPMGLTSGIVGGQVNVGLGLPLGPLPGNGAGGLSNSFVLYDFFQKK